MTKVKIFGEIPDRQTANSAGYDLVADLYGNQIEMNDSQNRSIYKVDMESLHLSIPAFTCAKIPTGIFIETPINLKAEIFSRSGLAWNKMLMVMNGVGIIDADYRGQIFVLLFNPTPYSVIIKNGVRIAQIVFSAFEQVEWEQVQTAQDLSKTDRGNGGFGSTGDK